MKEYELDLQTKRARRRGNHNGSMQITEHTFGGLRSLFNQAGATLSDIVKTRAIYSCDITRIAYITSSALAKVFPAIPEYTRIRIGETYDNDYNLEYVPAVIGRCGEMLFNDFTIYNGTPIVISMRSSNEDFSTGTVLLSTIRSEKHVRNLKMLIKKMTDYGVKAQIQKRSSTVIKIASDAGHPVRIDVDNWKLRTFNDVFLPDSQKQELLSAVDNYVRNRQWYLDNNIPNHFGILLYGEGGTGKTSIAQAITSHINGELTIIDGDLISELPNMINDSLFQRESIAKDRYRVFLVEDVDCGMLQNRSTISETIDGGINKSRGLAAILNTIDGISAPTNVIYIFTTNHIEKLDPALIRPGRMDIKMEIKSACYKTFCEFCKFHYGKQPETEFEIKEHMLFADLQTKVMSGMTMEQLSEYVKK